jgi:hypothetical protein
LPGQRLKKLWLDGSLLDDEGARYLARFDRLECLYVDKTEVTAAGIAHFRWLPNLEIVRGTASRFVPLKRLIAQEHVRAGVTIDAVDRLKVQVRY